MNNSRRAIGYLICMALGIVLLGLGVAEIVDAYWSGMGSGLTVVGILRMVRLYRFQKDESYREKVEVEVSDERNRFLRCKAWSWSGYLFLLIAGIAGIVLKVTGQDLLSMAASFALCLMLILYVGAYLILRKKY